MSKMFCLQCGKEVEWSIIKCPYCGFEYKKFMNAANETTSFKHKVKKEKQDDLSLLRGITLGMYK